MITTKTTKNGIRLPRLTTCIYYPTAYKTKLHNIGIDKLKNPKTNNKIMPKNKIGFEPNLWDEMLRTTSGQPLRVRIHGINHQDQP
jgi:hypothetical protein